MKQYRMKTSTKSVIGVIALALAGYAVFMTGYKSTYVSEDTRALDGKDKSDRDYRSNRCIEEDGKPDVLSLVEWPIDRRHQLPNYFTQGLSAGNTDDYATGNIVFLHLCKAGGQTVKSLFSTIAKKRNIPRSVIWWLNSTLVFSNLKAAGETKQQTYFMGDFAFGVCDLLQKQPCSYLTMVRNPFERIITAYYYCKQIGEPLCGPLSAHKYSLVDWAIHTGNRFFQQLLMHPNVCGREFEKYAYMYKNHTKDRFVDYRPRNQCWFVMKAFLKERLNPSERHRLLEYCLDNLENWFAAVGLLEEFQLSLEMFETVYQIPLKEVYHKPLNVGERPEAHNKTLRAQHLAELQDSFYAKEALHEDLMLYERIKAIFEKQKAVYKSMALKQDAKNKDNSA